MQYFLQLKERRQYSHAAQAPAHIPFPFVVLVDGVPGTRGTVYIAGFADRLSTKWSKPYSEVIVWLQTRLSLDSNKPMCAWIKTEHV